MKLTYLILGILLINTELFAADVANGLNNVDPVRTGNSGQASMQQVNTGKPETPKTPIVKGSDAVQRTPGQFAGTQNAMRNSFAQPMNSALRSNLQNQLNTQAMLQEQIYKDAKSGKYDNSKLPEFFQAMANSMKPLPATLPPQNTITPSTPDEDVKVPDRTPTSITNNNSNIVTTTGQGSNGPIISSPQEAADALVKMAGNKPAGKDSIGASKENLVSAPKADVPHELANIPGQKNNPSGSSITVVSGVTPNSGLNDGALKFNEKAPTGPTKEKAKSGNPLDVPNVVPVAGADNQALPPLFTPEQEIALKEKAKQLFEKQLQKAKDDGNMQQANLLEMVKSDPESYDKVIDTLSHQIAQNFAHENTVALNDGDFRGGPQANDEKITRRANKGNREPNSISNDRHFLDEGSGSLALIAILGGIIAGLVYLGFLRKKKQA